MEFGISRFTYGWAIGIPGSSPVTAMSEVDLLQLTVAFGLHTLQIGDNLPLHEFGTTRPNALAKLIREKNIRLEIGARGLTPDRHKANRFIDQWHGFGDRTGDQQSHCCGIPTVVYDSNIPNANHHAFLGTDWYEIGKMQGEEMVKLLNGKGKVAYMGILGLTNMEEGFQGLLDVLKKYPDIIVIGKYDDKANVEEAARITSDLLIMT